LLRAKEITTLNIEGSSVRLLTVKDKRVQKWGDMPLEPGVIKEGLILDPPGVGLVIRNLFASQNAPKKDVVVSLTALRAVPRFLNMPKMSPHLLKEAIMREAKREMPLPLDSLYLSWQAIGEVGNQQRIYLLGVPRDLLDAEVQALAAAGIQPSVIDLKPLALVRAVNREQAIIADLEPDSLDVIMVADYVPVIMRTFSLEEGLGLEEKIERLADELTRTVKFYNDSYPEKPFSPAATVCLTGALMGDRAARNSFTRRVDYPVEVPDPPLEYAPDLPLAQYVVNMGLALKKVR